MVIAGPGTGKTELLAIRTANILNTIQINPQNILLLTFTDSASHNMRSRLVGLIGDSAYRVAIYTFHSFASDIMGRYAEYFFNGANFKPATDIERINIIENILEKLDRDDPLNSKQPDSGYVYTRDIFSCISGLKKGNLSPEDFKESLKNTEKELENINNFAGEILEECSGSRKFDVVFQAYTKLYEELEKIAEQNSYARYLQNTLSLEIVKSAELNNYKNLNSWRDEFFTKGPEDLKILKDSRQEKIEKWLSFC